VFPRFLMGTAVKKKGEEKLRTISSRFKHRAILSLIIHLLREGFAKAILREKNNGGNDGGRECPGNHEGKQRSLE